MQKFEKWFFNSKQYPSNTYIKELKIYKELSKIELWMQKLFINSKIPSRLFAFIESKYSSKIEGIYTTLYDAVNTGVQYKLPNQIAPIVNALFTNKISISKKIIYKISEKLNLNVSSNKRWEKNFGIYNDKQEIIYQPLLDKKLVTQYLEKIIDKAKSDSTIIDILETHILFEKIHPFVDGNGRIGRLIIQKSLAKLTNFAYVFPLSSVFFKNRNLYYETFDIKKITDFNDSINILLDLVMKMVHNISKFLNALEIFKNKNFEFVKNTSIRVNDEIAIKILLTLQTKSIYLQRKYNLNPRTIESIFNKISNNEELPFNRKIANRNVLHWNLRLEEIINEFFE